MPKTSRSQRKIWKGGGRPPETSRHGKDRHATSAPFLVGAVRRCQRARGKEAVDHRRAGRSRNLGWDLWPIAKGLREGRAANARSRAWMVSAGESRLDETPPGASRRRLPQPKELDQSVAASAAEACPISRRDFACQSAAACCAGRKTWLVKQFVLLRATAASQQTGKASMAIAKTPASRCLHPPASPQDPRWALDQAGEVRVMTPLRLGGSFPHGGPLGKRHLCPARHGSR